MMFKSIPTRQPAPTQTQIDLFRARWDGLLGLELVGWIPDLGGTGLGGFFFFWVNMGRI